MAEQQKPVLLTENQDLGPGVTRTPGFVVDEPLDNSGIADRRVNHRGEPANHPTLSTYEGPVNGLASGPGTTVRAGTDVAPAPRYEYTDVTPVTDTSTVDTSSSSKKAS